jgi:3-methyladenine DNA glycosylase AlkD
MNKGAIPSAREIIDELKAMGSPEDVAGMARFGINTEKAVGIRLPVLRAFARPLRKQHELALELWKDGLYEARLLAAMIDDPKQLTETQMESWVKDFNSWAVCDCCCGELFDKSPLAYEKAMEWCHREAEYERRAGFVMMAELAVHDKKARDEKFLAFFPLMEQYAFDKRNFVKKAINWALRRSASAA